MPTLPSQLIRCLAITALFGGHSLIAQEIAQEQKNEPSKPAAKTAKTVAPAPLADAAQSGDETRVRELLETGANVDHAQGDGMTALHWAAQRDHANIARLLLDRGAGPDKKTRLGAYTPVHLASANGNAEVLTALLGAGGSARVATSTGTTPLHLAAASGNVEAVRALLRRGADVNATEKVADQTPLMFAAHRGQTDVIRILTKFGADVTRTTKVVRAASRSRTRAGTSRRPSTTGTPDPGAELRGSPARQETERAAARARPSRQPKPGASSPRRRESRSTDAGGRSRASGRASGRTSGRSRSSRGRRRTPSTPKKGGLSALLHACRQGHIEAAKALLDAGANIDKVSGCDKSSPLLIATINGHFDLAMMLLERGANPNLGNAAGAGPLYAAINVEWAPHAFYPQPSTAQERTSHLQLMQALLDKGADPDARLKTKLWYTGYNFDQSRENPAGSTAFWRAAQASDVAALRLLAAHGANPRIWSKVSSTRRRSSGLTGESSPTPKKGDAKATDRPKLPPVKVGDPACSALHMATGAGFKGNFHKNAPGGWLAAAKFLVDELGFDVNEPDHLGFTPMHHAAFRGDNEMIRYLVKKGGDVMAVARSGETTVDRANGPVQRLQPFPETIKLLESMGAKNNHRSVSR